MSASHRDLRRHRHVRPDQRVALVAARLCVTIPRPTIEASAPRSARPYDSSLISSQHVTDEDIEALLSDEIFQPKVIWTLADVQATCGTLGLSTLIVKLIASDGEEKIACSVGTGPVDAAYKAVDESFNCPFSGRGASMDVVVSSIRAYLSALHKMCSFAAAVKASSEVPESTSVGSKE